jgi:type II secretory pathway pseudopilin PulG
MMMVIIIVIIMMMMIIIIMMNFVAKSRRTMNNIHCGWLVQYGSRSSEYTCKPIFGN